MKNNRFFLILGLLVLTSGLPAATLDVPQQASQAEVNAGTVPNKYVSPRTLGGSTGPGAFATNFIPVTKYNFNTNVWFGSGWNPPYYNGSNVWNANLNAWSNSVGHGLLYWDGTEWVLGTQIDLSSSFIGADFFLGIGNLTNGSSPFVSTQFPISVGQWIAIGSQTNGYGQFVTNSSEISTYLTNYLIPDGTVVVCPYTNEPPSVTNSARIFGPWFGSNYVQMAVNACAQYADRVSGVGGGKIIVEGINYLPTTLTFSNALQANNLYVNSSYPNQPNVVSFTIEAPSFTGGALVCQTNPCIRVDDNAGAVDIYINIHGLIISSLDNSCTNLFDINTGVTRYDIHHNWFGPWASITNHGDSGYGVAGLVVPEAGGNISPHNLVIHLGSGGFDMANFSDNSLLGMGSVFFNPDHGDFSRNFFSACGGGGAWPTSSIYSSGAQVVIGRQINGDRTFYHNYFYSGANTPSYLTENGTPARDISYNDVSLDSGVIKVLSVGGGYLTLINAIADNGVTTFMCSVTNAGCFQTPDAVGAGFHNSGVQTNNVGFSVNVLGITGNAGLLTNFLLLVLTNNTTPYLTTGQFKTIPHAGLVTVNVSLTAGQQGWLTNATTHKVQYVGSFGAPATNTCVMAVSTSDSVAFTNMIGTPTLMSSFYDALK